MPENEIKNCPKCGSEAKFEISTGGGTIYWNIYCQNPACRRNNRHYPSEFLSSMGIGEHRFAPTERKVAIAEWAKEA